MRALPSLSILAALAVFLAGGCSTDDEKSPAPPVSSRSYKGHETDADANNLVAVYPSILGTRLDDCQTCHTGGTVYRGASASTLNPCSYCHLYPYPDATITSGAPTSYQDTLNPYGLAYKNAGKSQDALRNIAGNDSDTDTYGNETEISAGRYPGDPASMPGQPFAPIYTMEWAAVTALTPHRQFLLMNASKQQFDDYANYKGVKIVDLLAAAGVNLTGVTGITVVAPDGFMKDFTLAQIQTQFANGIYDSGLAPADFADPLQGLVNYPPAAQIPAGLADLGTIPDPQWLQLAWWRDGGDMVASELDPVSGKINGEGPYRLVQPQSNPGTPDRGSSYSPTTWGDGYDYLGSKDHNAGNCVRGVVAIRVNPMPAGFEEYDWKNGGWALIAGKKLILYGLGVSQN